MRDTGASPSTPDSGHSPRYAELSQRIAADTEILDRVAELPAGNKQQPNLLLGAVRYLDGPLRPWPEVRRWLLTHWAEIRALALRRSTQTNEAARCATLLPLLATLPQPLALIEVGASAGLCLFPDRYRYSFDERPAFGPEDSPLTLSCTTTGPVPVPAAVPEIAWRAGIDLNPLDVTDGDDVRWLEALIWPGTAGEARTRRLRAAIRAIGNTQPRIVRGDLLDRLPELAAQAPAHATLVVLHTAVLAYLTRAEGERFTELVSGLPGHWVSNEGHWSLPWFPGPRPDDESLFTLSLDGKPAAFTAPHGQNLHWLDPAAE